MTFIKVGLETDLLKGFMKPFKVGDKTIVIVDVAGKLYAFDDKCTHMGGHLSNGLLTENIVTCPLHGSQFDVMTGERKAGPAHKPIMTYPVKVVDGEIFIDPNKL